MKNKVKYLWVLDYNTGRVSKMGEFPEDYLNSVDIESMLDDCGFNSSDVHYMVTDFGNNPDEFWVETKFDK